MTEEEMRDLILSRVPTYVVTHQQLWLLCGSPQGDNSALFDKVLLSLAANDKIASMTIQHQHPLRGYAKG